MKNSKWYFSFLLVLFLSQCIFGQNTSFVINGNNLTAGQAVNIPVLVNDFDAVIGFQFTINWDPEVLDFQSIGGFDLDNLDQTNFGFAGIEQGYLTCFWTESSFSGIDVMDEIAIFSLAFQVNCSATEASVIEFSDTPTDALLIYEGQNTLPVTSIPTMINGTYSFDGISLNLNPIVYPISCVGQNDAIIEANVSGGTAPYAYEWDGNVGNSVLDNIGPGNYFLLVTDANNCETIAPFITVNVPDSIHICTIDISYDASCAGNGACIDLTICESSDSLTYQWSNGMTTASICNLVEGIYTVTVTNENGCSAQNEMIVVEDNGYNPMSAQFVSVDSTCALPGMIHLSVLNGQGEYNFDWSNGGNESILENLGAGEYYCTISDDVCEIVVGPITVNAIQPDLTIAADITLPICIEDQGSINVTATSNAMPLTYLWNTGSQENNLENLSPGEYLLTVTDANACTLQSDIFIILEGATVSATDIQIDSTTCDGFADGSISVVPIGGTMPYTFEFSNGETANPTIVAEGMYMLTITDDLGCTAIIENLEVFSPSAIEVIDQVVTDYLDTANSGSIDLTVFGGTPPYSFNWSNGGTTNPLESLDVGSYTCSITDANNCELIIENIMIDQIVSIEEVPGFEIRLYPNPVRDYLYLETNMQIDFLELYTIDGSMVQRYTQLGHNDIIDIQNVDSGIYWVKVISKTETILTKLVVWDKR